ncbi:MAG: hypothetical protein AB1679_24080 [Actinomycetota bacterium]
MRSYIGQLVDGAVHLGVSDPAPRPTMAEVGGLLHDLAGVGDGPAPPDLVARKALMISRIEAAEAASALTPILWGRPDLPGWSTPAGRSWLARVILSEELGAPAARWQIERFAADVVATLPPDRFRLPAADVAAWVERNRLDVPVREAARASALVAACESAWDEIQGRHGAVPDAVIILGSGVERGRLVKLGHWWGGRWLADGTIRGEVLLAGEALHLPATEVFEVLLHEAAHGLNAARGVRDTSREGRYHNARFRDTAEQLGLAVSMTPQLGWARTTLTPKAAEDYRDTIETLASAMRLSRTVERDTTRRPGRERSPEAGEPTSTGNGAQRTPRTRNGVGAACGCGRHLRMAPSVLAQGPVLCGLCGSEFGTGKEAEQSAARSPARFPAAPAVSGCAAATERLVSGIHPATTLAGWEAAWDTDDEAVLTGATDSEVQRLNQLARTELRRAGRLTGPAVIAGGIELQVGDRVVAGPAELPWPEWSDCAASYAPAPPIDAGYVGDVSGIDPKGRWVEIDFPCAGRARFTVSDFEPGALAYGYAVSEDDLLADLTLPRRTAARTVEPDVPRPGRAAEVTLP